LKEKFMVTYESEIKKINSNAENIFNKFVDLQNLNKLINSKLNEDQIKDIKFTEDGFSFSIEGLGRIGFRMVEKDPFKTIKFELQELPVQANAWIQLMEKDENDTRMKLTFKAEIPAMLKMMVDKKLKEGVNLAAEVIANAFNNANS